MEALFAGSDLDLMLSMDNRNAAFAALANYPALTVPLGYSDSGRPVNLTLFAPPFRSSYLWMWAKVRASCRRQKDAC